MLAIGFVSCAVSGQQPKPKGEPYVPALLPAEEAWRITLPALPSASAAMDGSRVYVPLRDRSPDGDPTEAPAATLIALDRETGDTVWEVQTPTEFPPVIWGGMVLVASGPSIQALEPRSGARQWSIPVPRPVRTPLVVRGALLLAMLEGDEFVAVDLTGKTIAWRTAIGESGPVQLTASEEAVYVATAAGRVLRVNLSDAATVWRRDLEGVLTEPAADGDRVFVGSGANLGSLWGLDSETGRVEWAWPGRIFGGDVVGSVSDGDIVYVVSKDNYLRGLDRRNGHERWKRPIPRPVLPPRLVERTVLVTGTEPTLATFLPKSGMPVATWSAPSEGLLQGPPLIDEPRPFHVAIVVVLRSGQVIALRPKEMLFDEAAPTPLNAVPGRALPRDRLFTDPESP